MQAHFPKDAPAWLAGLTDTELAFVHVYKARALMYAQRMLIRREMEDRHLDEQRARALVKDARFKKEYTGCRRCGSAGKSETAECTICGYGGTDRSQWQWLWEMIDAAAVGFY